MKRIIARLAALALVAALAFTFVACKVHVYGDYVYDDTNHWQECIDNDGVATDKEAHTLEYNYDDDAHWQVCSICGYESKHEAHVYDNATDLDCNVCGAERTTEQAVLAYLTSLETVSVEGTDLYASSWEDIVKALKDAKIIEGDGIDMNTTAGYIVDYTGVSPETPIEVADKAYDYNGVWVFYWDLKNTTHGTTYTGLINNSGTIVIGGGQYTVPTSASNGAVAIAYKDVVAAVKGFSYDWTAEGATYDDYKAKLAECQATAEAPYADAIKAFNALSANAQGLDYLISADSLAILLKKAGFITVTDLAGEAITSEYTYPTQNWKKEDTTGTLTYASTAKKYGKIKVYYYDTLSGLGKGLQQTYDQLAASKSASLYCQLTYGGDYVEYKANAGETVYNADGTAVKLDVEFVYGRFAIAFEE